MNTFAFPDGRRFDSEAFIAQCRALLITGTHLSTPAVRAAASAALGHARKHGVMRVLDIDYRPVLWGVTKRGAGENRFVADAQVTAQLQEMLGQFDLLIGTEEEFLIAGGIPDDLIATLKRVREVTPAALAVKLGAKGCAFIPGAVPDRIENALTLKDLDHIENLLKSSNDGRRVGVLDLELLVSNQGLVRHTDPAEVWRIDEQGSGIRTHASNLELIDSLRRFAQEVLS